MRIKRGVISNQRRRKLLASTKGYRMTKRRLVRVAHEAALHAGEYAFAGRKKKKSDFRRLWITRISHAVRADGMSYSQFINRLKKANIALDRKMLSYLLNTDSVAFQAVVDKVKAI